MNKAKRVALISIPVVVAVAAAVALAGSQGGSNTATISVLMLAFAYCFAIQWLAFVPAYLGQTERFFDITGSVTYITVTWLAILVSGSWGSRSLLLALLISVWAFRLGTFLVRRVHRAGKDGRFDEIKTSFVRFLSTWTLQGLWVSLTLAAALTAITTTVRKPLGPVAWGGLAVWLIGFGIEAMADLQKNRFRACPENAGRFIQSGLWAWSRHPNYFGEIVLWIGIALIALPVLRGWQFVTLISPLFVVLLLTRVSGIPMLEKRADETWGNDAAYYAYKQATPILVPRPPRR